MHDFVHDDEKFSNSMFYRVCILPYFVEYRIIVMNHAHPDEFVLTFPIYTYLCVCFKYDEVQVAHLTHWPLGDFKEILGK